MYSIVYKEIMPESSAFPWKTVGLVILVVGAAASAAVGIAFLVVFCRKQVPKKKVQKDPYADRPKMHRPEMLRQMDRGLEDER